MDHGKCSVYYDKAKENLKLKMEKPEKCSFIIRNISDLKSVENASSCKYYKATKALYISAFGNDLNIEIYNQIKK